jgi:hypothetical protein
MLSGTAPALSDLPVELIERHHISRRVHDRGGEREVRFSCSTILSESCPFFATGSKTDLEGREAAEVCCCVGAEHDPGRSTKANTLPTTAQS